MDLILKQPIEELTPKIIAFNNEELLKQVEIYLQKFETVKYDDNTISDAKSAVAELNKASSALNAFRLQVQKVYEKPIKDFKEKVDEVRARIDTVSSKIKESVDDFTERQKQFKRTQINDYYLSSFDSLAVYVPLEKIYKSNWENKSYSLNLIKSEIDEIHDRIVNDIEAIYEMYDVDQISLKFLYFKALNLGVALNEYNREKAEKDLLKQKEQERIEKAIDWNKNVNSIGKDDPILPVEEKLYSLSFKCHLTKKQAEALKTFLVSNNIKYEKI